LQSVDTIFPARPRERGDPVEEQSLDSRVRGNERRIEARYTEEVAALTST
jgi:hypothetical protein